MTSADLLPAEELLLIQFRTPREVPNKGFLAGHTVEEWRDALHQPLPAALNALAAEGLIRAATNEEVLEQTFKVPELKAHIRTRGLSTTGKKAELAARLAQADPNLATSSGKGRLIFKSTKQGDVRIAEILGASQAARSRDEDSTTALLASGDYRKAAATIAEFEAQQVFPRGIGVDWAHYDTSRDERVLEYIFTHLPQSLAKEPPNELSTFRVAAGMLHLVWNVGQTSTWLANRFPRQDDESLFKISSDLHSFGLFLTEVESLKAMGAKAFQVLTCNDDVVCPSCQELASRDQPINSPTQIPNPGCTSKWCRCWIRASFPHLS